MKIILVSQRPEIVRDFFIGTGQAIVAELASPDSLFPALVKATPHFVFLDRPIVPAGSLDTLSQRFPAVRFARIDFGHHHREKQFLNAFRHPRHYPAHSEIPEQRHILFDPAYMPYLKGEKLGVPVSDITRADDEAADLRRLADLVNATRERRLSFEWRWEGLHRFESFESVEIVYRLVHDSAKAAAYAREQVGRYLAVLAHSVPATETVCLPCPYDPAPIYRYTHYATSPETCYAVASVMGFGCHPKLAEQLMVMLGWRFMGENSALLMKSTVPMLGLLFALRRIAESHRTVMAWLLDGQLPDPFTRSDRRHLQTFRDFWCFSYWLENPALLQRYIDHAETYRRQPPLAPMVSFAEFFEQNGVYPKGDLQ